MEGNCYYISEAAYHILGGKKAGWKAAYVRTFHRNSFGPSWPCHWFLIHKSGLILDLSKRQFHGKIKPDYSKGRGSFFLTKKPSKRARKLMRIMTWK